MKNKILFAGFMGAILMSVGAANAATTTIATRGYVDSKITTLDDKFATPASVTQALNDKVTDLNLSQYQPLADRVNEITSTMTDEEKSTKYPTVKAVLDAIPDLTPEQMAAIENLTGNTGLITRVTGLENKMTGDATVDGSVANQIATALTNSQADWTQSDTDAADYIKNKPSDLVTTGALNTALAGYTTTSALDTKLADYTKTTELPTYQAKSTADFQIGTTGGVFRTMTDTEKAALASGIDSTKVTQIETNKTDIAGINTKMAGINDGETVVGLIDAAKTAASGVGDKLGNIPEGSTVSAELDKKQDKSTAAYSMGGENGAWDPLEQPQIDALNSGITQAKVAAYDVLNGDATQTGSVANLKASVDAMTADGGVIKGLQDTVAGHTTSIGTNTDDITALEGVVGATEDAGLRGQVKTNTQDIADNATAITTLQTDKISKPAECTGPQSTCVLMIQGDNIVWTPVTEPIEDPATPAPTPAAGE